MTVTELRPAAAHDLAFTIAGEPATQGSKRHVGRGRMVEADTKLPAWRAAVVRAAKEAAGPGWLPLDGALSAELTVYLGPRPKASKFGDWPAGPPDLDKLQRAVGDALKIAGVISDDARIVHWDASKQWGERGADVKLTTLQPGKSLQKAA